MMEFLGFTNYNPNEIYLNTENEIQHAFPRYYENDYNVYKIDKINSINPITNCVFYKGTIVKCNFEGQSINENIVFTLPKNIHEVSEVKFNAIYNKIKQDSFPKYFYHPGRSSYIKVIKEARINGDSVYCCTVIEPRDARIEGQRQLSKFAIDRDCTRITEKDYEKIFKEVIEKIK